MKTYMRVLTVRLQSLVVVVLVLFGLMVRSSAQNNDSAPVKYAVQAAQFCQEGQFEKAENAIKKALESDDEKNALYTWYVKGFVHKEIYKVRESNLPHSNHRDLAVEAFLKSKEMANGHPDTYNNNSALKYLASTYYNDAIALAVKFDLSRELEADEVMKKYDELCVVLSTEGLNKGQFFKQKGMRYYELWQKNTCDVSLNEKAYACFITSLENDASDCDAFYNAGVVRYSLVQNMMNQKPENCKIELDKKSELEAVISILLQGQKNCKEHLGITKALQNTYMAIGENEKADELEKLIKP